MLLVGHTRFSLFSPDSGAWVASNGSKLDADEYIEYLFSATRMDPRCEIFFNLTLPQLAIASAGHLFRHVVSFSESLPDIYKAQLVAAAEKFPFLILDEVADGEGMRNIARTARQVMSAEGLPLTTVYGAMRLDDDDVLSADYFEQMAPYIIKEKVGYVVSLARGVAALYSDGQFYFARDAVFHMHSKGHLRVCRFDENGNYQAPVGAPHNLADRFNPVVIDSRKFSHIWVRSTNQDSSVNQIEKGEKSQLARIYIDMAKYPQLETNLDEAFPVLAGMIHTEKPKG